MLFSLLAATVGVALTEAVAVRGGSGCELHLTAGDAISGPVGENSSGQVRAGSGVTSSTFTLRGNQLWDDQGRGCWWTPPTFVLQCDNNQNPAEGFTVGCDGSVSFSGQTTFFECQTGEQGQFNVYLQNGHGNNCGALTLNADQCHSGCPPPPPPPPPPKGCPADLNGPFEFPHLIIPVSKSQPNQAMGTSFFGEISSTVSSIFNFDIPSSDEGKQCSLVFLFPEAKDLQTSSFTFSGSGHLDFAWLDAPAVQGTTTWNSQPGKKQDFGATTVAPGNGYVIATFACPAGEKIGFEISEAGDTYLKWFEDFNPAPIGLYVRVC